mmetsp:Transcript_8699/g.25807  ORF Transcript_8699/g.25807 Transcript_8699/m.25807 type:complete len:243 (-) Transcript_8699:466-1194(-)
MVQDRGTRSFQQCHRWWHSERNFEQPEPARVRHQPQHFLWEFSPENPAQRQYPVHFRPRELAQRKLIGPRWFHAQSQALGRWGQPIVGNDPRHHSVADQPGLPQHERQQLRRQVPRLDQFLGSHQAPGPLLEGQQLQGYHSRGLWSHDQPPHARPGWQQADRNHFHVVRFDGKPGHHTAKPQPPDGNDPLRALGNGQPQDFVARREQPARRHQGALQGRQRGAAGALHNRLLPRYGRLRAGG